MHVHSYIMYMHLIVALITVLLLLALLDTGTIFSFSCFCSLAMSSCVLWAIELLQVTLHAKVILI